MLVHWFSFVFGICDYLVILCGPLVLSVGCCCLVFGVIGVFGSLILWLFDCMFLLWFFGVLLICVRVDWLFGCLFGCYGCLCVGCLVV